MAFDDTNCPCGDSKERERADGAKGADGREHYTAFQAGDVWAFETPYGVSAGYMSKVSAQKRADATRQQDEERRLKAGGAL